MYCIFYCVYELFYNSINFIIKTYLVQYLLSYHNRKTLKKMFGEQDLNILYLYLNIFFYIYDKMMSVNLAVYNM